VNGVAVTGGLEIALSCDLRIASERAVFADTHARVGVMPGWGLTVRLPQVVGQARALEMSLAGTRVDAATALSWGLVNHVVPHGELLSTALDIARRMTEPEPVAASTLLRMYRDAAELPLGEGSPRWTGPVCRPRPSSTPAEAEFTPGTASRSKCSRDTSVVSTALGGRCRLHLAELHVLRFLADQQENDDGHEHRHQSDDQRVRVAV
jgi:hypothetical protein